MHIGERGHDSRLLMVVSEGMRRGEETSLEWGKRIHTVFLAGPSVGDDRGHNMNSG